MNKKNQYRTGTIGALMDEYERAITELKSVLEKISDGNFEKIFNKKSADEPFLSVKLIMTHVIDAAYRYANQIRIFLGINPIVIEFKMESRHDALRWLEKAVIFTANSIEGFWDMTDEEILRTRRETRWGLYDIEMMFEHAIVHILRHRRQIEKFLDR